MRKKLDRMRELISILNEASRAYYMEGGEIMSNLEYDRRYDELAALEQITGIILANSPTQHVGYEVVSALPKETHAAPMLSLDKTKDRDALRTFAGTQTCQLSWKLDGLTVVMTYQNGRLFKAVTRGNGTVGEVITNNARVFKNLPLRIPYQGTLILRGEAVISYEDFLHINEELGDADAKYKNPRNLCSGSVRQLNSGITAQRNVHFIAFALVRADGIDFSNSRGQQLAWLKEQGFAVVEHQMVNAQNMQEAVERFAGRIRKNRFPSDGLVLQYDDIAYGQSLGRTAKFPRDSIALKWADEVCETTLTEIEWSPSRTGLINPVAVFAPVELEGTTVSRASVHNVSTVKELALGVGDRITVYKANMIIPQIARNLTKSGKVEIPERCPVCGSRTRIDRSEDVEVLYCPNPQCQVKHVKAFVLLVSRDALNVEGLSEASLEKLIKAGFLKTFADLFHLQQYREEIVQIEGFGEKSYEKLIAAIERARNTTLSRLVYGLGIANIGVANAKLLCKAFNNDLAALQAADTESLAAIPGIGEVIAEGIRAYFADPQKQGQLMALCRELHLETPRQEAVQQTLEGKTIVITGSVHHFANRNELKALIERLGGKVTNSVTKNTDYLINNDTTSGTSKNKKARELSVPILSEEAFLKLCQSEQ